MVGDPGHDLSEQQALLVEDRWDNLTPTLRLHRRYIGLVVARHSSVRREIAAELDRPLRAQICVVDCLTELDDALSHPHPGA